jgi:chemotaxis protein methyltransferase CheR
MLLYFNKQHVDAVEDRLYGALAPAGWLLLGQAESIRSKRERWIMHIYPGTVVYQKPEPDLSLRAGEVAYRTRISTTAPRGNNDGNEFPTTDEGGSSLVPTYSDAVDAFQDDRLEAAERYLAELLIRHPGHARAHALLATIFANRQAIPEAHAHLSMALEADPLLADAHYLHALLHFEEGLVDNARKSLHAALYCQPEHPLAAFMLGNLYAANGHLPQAYRAWNNARRATTHLDPEAYVSDLSDLTVANFDTLVNHQLEGVD